MIQKTGTEGRVGTTSVCLQHPVEKMNIANEHQQQQKNKIFQDKNNSVECNCIIPKQGGHLQEIQKIHTEQMIER